MSSLGDLFCALPTVHAIKKGLDVAVDWVVHEAYVDLVRCFTDVDQVLGFPRHGFACKAMAFFRALRQRRYAYILDLQGLLKSALVCRLARGGRRIGPSFCREGTSWLLAERAGTLDKNRHAVEECLDTAHYLGVDPGTLAFPVRPPPSSIALHRPSLGLLPGSRWPTKNWDADFFIETISLLRRHKQVQVVLLGGPAEATLCRTIADGLDGDVLELAGKTTLVEMLAVLRDLDALLAVDSGPLHAAASLGTPLVALYGPTDPLRTGPYGCRDRVLTVTDLACRPCFSRTCERGDRACMGQIQPQRVVEMLLEIV